MRLKIEALNYRPVACCEFCERRPGKRFVADDQRHGNGTWNVCLRCARRIGKAAEVRK